MMKDQYYYQCYGQIFASEVPCPELFSASQDRPADCRIVFGSLTFPLQDNPTGWMIATPGRCLFLIEGVARFRVEGGHTITIDPLPNADAGDIRLFLLGTALGILLHQQGRLPLHVSAVLHNHQAHAFCGPSGAGKSTLAAALQVRGFPLLCDDVGLIVPVDKGILLYPGFPRIKLWQDALDHLSIPSQGLIPDQTRLEKYHLLLDKQHAGFHADPVMLAGLYELERLTSDRPASVVAVEEHETLAMAIRHTYRPRLMRETGCPGLHLQQCGCLSKRVPGYRFQRPWALDQLDAGLDGLMDHFNSVSFI